VSSISLDDRKPDDEQEWLLLRDEAMQTTSGKRACTDGYADIHPLIRKYAATMFPEVNPGEPRWANPVLSRRWEREEMLEQDKLARQGEDGLRPATCRTERQEVAHQCALATLCMLRELRGPEEEGS